METTEKMITEKITLDMLTKDSVSILKQQFDDEENQVGLNVRCAYMNTAKSREKLKQDLPPEKWDELIAVWGDEPTIEDPKIPEPDIESVKASLINQMSNECNRIILNGVDLEMSDEKTYHFSMQIEDQLKIQALALKVKNGETELPYHADGEPCRFFSVDEILALNQAMEYLITYQTTYFNSLRTYVQNIKDIDTLSTIK